jgi:hypothetical protein
MGVIENFFTCEKIKKEYLFPTGTGISVKRVEAAIINDKMLQMKISEIENAL